MEQCRAVDVQWGLGGSKWSLEGFVYQWSHICTMYIKKNLLNEEQDPDLDPHNNKKSDPIRINVKKGIRSKSSSYCTVVFRICKTALQVPKYIPGKK
jgi:hypothetical protein